MDEIKTDDRDFKGVWIPRDIWFTKELSWTEKILLAEIDSLDKGLGCWASNEYFAEFLDKSEARVADVLTNLRKLGFIEDVSFDGRKRYIRVAEFVKTRRQGSCFQEGRVRENKNADDEKIPLDVAVEPQNEGQASLINTSNNTIINTHPFLKFPLPNDWSDNSYVDSDGRFIPLFEDEYGRPIKQAEITKRQKAYMVAQKTAKTKAETATEDINEMLVSLAKAQGIKHLDGVDNIKHAKTFKIKFIEHLTDDMGLSSEEADKSFITQFRGLLREVEGRSPFHWKNMTSFGYLDRNFNKIIKDLK